METRSARVKRRFREDEFFRELHRASMTGCNNATTGTIWIHNHESSKRIDPIRLSEYTEAGWSVGRRRTDMVHAWEGRRGANGSGL